MGAIDASMASIEGGDAGVTIEGDAAFKQYTETDLAYLMTTPTGRKPVVAEVATGKHLTISPTEGSNFGKGATDEGDLRWYGGRGEGTGATIHYNPQLTTIDDGSEDWMHRPPAIGLGHEMIHAYADMTGTTPTGTTHGIKDEERQAFGLPPYADSEFSEDRIRAEAGLEQRSR
jgi:hypothetical protein